MTVSCAMCGEATAEPAASYSVPPALVGDMRNGDAVDLDDVAWEVMVDLCRECAEVAKRMAVDHDASPLPECDATRVRYDDAAAMGELAGGEVGAGDLTERMVEDALATAESDARADRPMDARGVEARVIALSARNLGLIGAVPF